MSSKNPKLNEKDLSLNMKSFKDKMMAEFQFTIEYQISGQDLIKTRSFSLKTSGQENKFKQTLQNKQRL